MSKQKQIINSKVFERLMESFDQLEGCIARTQDALARRGEVSEEVVERVSNYHQIVEKQRVLAQDLKSQIEVQNWGEVNRYVRIINGLSAMIRDDAASILNGEPGAEASKRVGAYLC